ncbi:uncharacterized protein K452DRAFT_329163 [Aplosporella prunicola CBS 121167]|uniref:Major facilitator superfamily (MFS) profile domain-containing protein n=1 Tax=Aplosporella prunicola CBS 121167 TaxID=1176127 RepID=A0A6A6B319_9PEZI|nr:uncharacterized protein K452DRAFT_329163 [Aplosporella prunicola CBS 121167]KAF2137645.1 hypothetical protein K452DRAFT_329163 [Aplosporella prunicola CBS 121167]
MSRQECAEAALPDQTNFLPKRELITVFCTLSVCMTVCFIDQNGIGTMLPSVSRDLHAENTISWAGTSALIANTVFQVLYGRLSDLFGRKVVFISALVLLSISDLLCGLSVNPTMLYVFRALAGVAGGGITSLTMMIVSDIVSLEKRGRYQGILGSMIGLGNLLGPLLGATFSQLATWRALYYLLCPIAALCGVLSCWKVPSTMRCSDYRAVVKKIDFYGLVTGSLAVICILIPVSGGGSYFDWGSAFTIAMLTIGGLCAVAFVLVEWKVAALPMLPLSLFHSVPVATMLLQNFLFGYAFYAYIYHLPLFFQNALGHTPLQSALFVFPLVIAHALCSSLSGWYISARNRYIEVLWAGFALWTLAAALITLFDRALAPAAMLPVLALCGAGVGLVFQPTLVALQAHSPKKHRAVVIAARNFLRSLGGAVGLAAEAAVLQKALRDKLPAPYKALASSAFAAPEWGGGGGGVYGGVGVKFEDEDEVRDAYAKASRAVFVSLVPFLAACLLGCALVRDCGLLGSCI